MSDWTEAAVDTAIRARKAETGKGTSIRVGPEVWHKLLTLQYERKMAGEQVSMSEIIEQLLNQSEAA